MIKLDKKGMTLLETVVALGIFGIVIVSAVGLFVNGYNTHRRAIEMNNLQREGGYLLERISREIRMANKNDSTLDTINSGTGITFISHDAATVVIYCRANNSASCDPTGDFLAVSYDGTPSLLSSSSVKVNNLNFSIVGAQPIVIISMELMSVRDTSVELLLQTSVVPRVY